MSKVCIPQGYKTPLSVYEMQRAIEFIKSNFQVNLGNALNLRRVSAPLFVEENSGLNDNLNGVERPVSFDIPDVHATGQVVHSLAKWKRLALKRYQFHPGKGLFTDMNAIRVSLYKRERMKDQSRYLRYEEAVGSTGQSQGIYIQFLIAVIHYISSINAPADSAGVLGKTIFIDNPFGAAKDIYIWEPIFKLLKTNHVQLIVPARGATPAITGRFDVNYILGQKLVHNRQQTVVVDYYSRTKNEELEYTRMDYEQAVFDFI